MKQKNDFVDVKEKNRFPIHTGIGAKAIIIKDENTLILFGKDGTSDLPGGKVEQESILDGLRREIIEEINLSVAIHSLLTTWTFYKNTYLKIIGQTYLCKYISGSVKLSKEHIDYQWVDPAELDRFNFRRSYGLNSIFYKKYLPDGSFSDLFWKLPQIN